MLHLHASGNSREHTWPSHQQQGKTNIYTPESQQHNTAKCAKTKTSNFFSSLRKESNGNEARELATKIASKILAQSATANKEKPGKLAYTKSRAWIRAKNEIPESGGARREEEGSGELDRSRFESRLVRPLSSPPHPCSRKLWNSNSGWVPIIRGGCGGRAVGGGGGGDFVFCHLVPSSLRVMILYFVFVFFALS